MKLHSKVVLIVFAVLCLLLFFSMGMQPTWNPKKEPAPQVAPIWTCGSMPVYSLTLVPEGEERAGGCIAPTHIELIYENPLMTIVDGLAQGTIEPGEVLKWETPAGMEMVDKDGQGRDLRYLTHDDLVYLDQIRIQISPWNKSVISMLAQQLPPDRKVFLYWHIEADILAPIPPIPERD